MKTFFLAGSALLAAMAPPLPAAEQGQKAGPGIAAFVAPEGISVNSFAGGDLISSPAAISFHPGGGLFVVASPGTGAGERIVLLRDTDGDGRADSSQVWADGFGNAGSDLLAIGDGSLFYTNPPHLWKLVDDDGDGSADRRLVVQDGFGDSADRSGRGLVRGPDGKIYWTVGGTGYTVTTAEGRHYDRGRGGAVFRCDPDGSNVEEFHRGLIEPVGLAFDRHGNLFVCDGGVLGTGGWLVAVVEGGDSGRDHGAAESEGGVPAIAELPGSPAGLLCNYGATAMPDRYANHFWALHAGAEGGVLEALGIEPWGAGFRLSHRETLLTGPPASDLEFGSDGRLYVCTAAGIQTLSADGGSSLDKVAETREMLDAGFDEQPPERLVAMLAHDDMRVRLGAQFELVDRSRTDLLAAAAERADQRLARLHGIWGLGQLAEDDASLHATHIALLADPDEEVRAQAARVLADSRVNTSGRALVRTLEDPSPRVRYHAVIGVGKCRVPQAIPRLLTILEENDDQDPFLRHACVQSLWYLNEREKILKLVDHESAAVRLAVVLTLRKLEDPRVSYFLGDPAARVRSAAIRAIGEGGLFTARADLAAHIENYLGPAEGFSPPETPEDLEMQRWLIEANLQSGDAASARRLIDYAATAHLPSSLREEALDALYAWTNPPPSGLRHPSRNEDRSSITTVVKENLGAVFSASGGSGGIATKAARLGERHGVALPSKLPGQ